MKPTYGLVSRYGLIAFASSLDQIGPITRNVEDSALLLEAISGHDPKDSTSLDIPVKKYNIKKGVKGLRIGVPKEYFMEGLDPEIENNVRTVLKKLENEGAVIVDVSLPHSDYAVPTYYIVATAEASSNLERFDGVKYAVSPMEWSIYGNMKEEDVRAIYRYLRTIKPISNKPPANIPSQ